MPALHAHQAGLLQDQPLHQEQPHCQRPMTPRQALGREVRVMLRKNLKLGLAFSDEGCNISSCVLRAPQIAGWSSLVARRAHNPEAVGSNPAPATKRYRRSEAIFSGLRFVFASFWERLLGRIWVETFFIFFRAGKRPTNSLFPARSQTLAVVTSREPEGLIKQVTGE